MATFDGKQMLPHRPHLDHLRKQAKARLSEMRDAQPGARLADAQRALAQAYGFANWGLLRDEVLRRTGAPTGHDLQRRPRRVPPAYRAQHEAALEQAAQAETHAAFFLSAGSVNIGVMFIIVAIVLALWVFTSALPGMAATP